MARDTIAKVRADYGPRLTSLELVLGIKAKPLAIPKPDTLAAVRKDYGPRLTAIEDAMTKWCCREPKAAVQPPSTTPPVVVPPPAVSPPPPPPPVETPNEPTVVVSNPAELRLAAQAATSPTLIRCRPGVYDLTWLGNIAAPNVTVTSYDPSNRAVFTNFNLDRASGITFRGLTLRVVPPVYYAFQVTNCRDVYFRGCLVYGAVGSNPQDNGEGIIFLDCVNVGVIGCELHTLLRVMGANRCTNLAFEDNHAHNFGVTFHMITQITTGSIRRNYVTGPHVIPGDHPDGLQAFTDGTDASSTDITFATNLVTRGDGNIGQQGIFVGVHDRYRFPFIRTVIDDNLLVGTGYNGICFGGSGLVVDGLQISRNALLSLDADALKTWITVQGDAGRDISITDNEAIYMSVGSGGVTVEDLEAGAPLPAGFTNVTCSGNTLNTPTLDAGAARIAAWLAAHPEFTAYTLSL